MKIADFLENAAEEILLETVAYARTIVPLKHEDEAALRDHLPAVLREISADLRRTQSRTESISKSHGDGQATGDEEETAAETHGRTRARIGLHITQLCAEYRALRACVLRLWGDSHAADADSVRDIGRFNEAIDQALAESVTVYAREREHWQQIFLGVLGHDLRGPLNAITLTGELMARTAPADLARHAETLRRSTRRMTSLMDSLLDYNRAGLGGEMEVKRTPVDLASVCKDEVDMQRVALDGALIELITEGDASGEFDASRVREALGNLVTNAVKHGAQVTPVVVTVVGDASTVRMSVQNAAVREMSHKEIELMFDPLTRGSEAISGAARTHLGLGLFIVRQIARAHGGEVSGVCVSQKVLFTLQLPKF